mgnify:CR=1 FL=1|jgi:two-component system phosphate regulon sensor histidine kinase PhoR
MSLFGKKNTLLESVVSRYFDSCLILFGDAKIKDLIKGKFPAIQYTLSGYDISELAGEEKAALVSLLFHLDVNERGEKQAISALEDTINKVKERLGVDKDFTDLLLNLPEGVFAAEKLKIIPRQDLESQFMALVRDLQKTREALNTSVSKQTLDLAAEKDILKITLYNASDGVFALDKDGLIITFNKKMEDLTGFRHEEVKGKKADEVVRLFDDSMPLDSTKYSPTVEHPTDRNVYSNNKVTLVSRNGVKKYVRMISAVLNEPTEKNLGSIVTLTDITKEIELENMKIDFVSIAAHELRTPLTSIRGYLELLSSKMTGSLDEQSKKYLEKVVVSADQLHILVENLLNISRIEKGSLILNKLESSMEAVIQESMALFQAMAAQAGVTINYIKPKNEIPNVFIDHTMMLEVVSNLLDNAIKYNKPEGTVAITCELVDDKVVTHVKDTGIGIPAESLPHIFKKFYRTSTNVLVQGRKGTGLGLFISKQIVELHGGQISLTSELGNGTTFSFSVPINKKT